MKVRFCTYNNSPWSTDVVSTVETIAKLSSELTEKCFHFTLSESVRYCFSLSWIPFSSSLCIRLGLMSLLNEQVSAWLPLGNLRDVVAVCLWRGFCYQMLLPNGDLWYFYLNLLLLLNYSPSEQTIHIIHNNNSEGHVHVWYCQTFELKEYGSFWVCEQLSVPGDI